MHTDQQYENGQTTITMDTHGLWHTGLNPGGPALALGLFLVGQAERQHLQQMREHHPQQLSLSRQNVPHCHQVPTEQRMAKQCVSGQRVLEQRVLEQCVLEQCQSSVY